MPRRTWTIIPWSIWCKESRMCIWNMQNEEHNQKALKSKWAPATERLLSYWMDLGPGLVLLSLLPSTATASLKSKPLASPLRQPSWQQPSFSQLFLLARCWRYSKTHWLGTSNDDNRLCYQMYVLKRFTTYCCTKIQWKWRINYNKLQQTTTY